MAGDFIVGFCGETEEDFQQTIELVRRVQYESLFIFKYSPRPGTKADRREDDTSDEVKARRNNELLAVQNEIGLARKRALIGCEVEVLVEGPSKAARKAQGERRSQLRTRGKAAPAFATDATKEHRDKRTPIQRDGGTVQLVGRTPGDSMALFEAPPEYAGAIVTVLVDDASANSLFGRVTGIVSPPRSRPSIGSRSTPAKSLRVLPQQ